MASVLAGCARTDSNVSGDVRLTTICAGDISPNDLSIYGEEACLTHMKYWGFPGLRCGEESILPFTIYLRNENDDITIDSIKVADTLEHGRVTMQYQHNPLLPGEVVGVKLTIHVDRSCTSGEYPFAIVFQATGHEAQQSRNIGGKIHDEKDRRNTIDTGSYLVCYWGSRHGN